MSGLIETKDDDFENLKSYAKVDINQKEKQKLVSTTVDFGSWNLTTT